MKLEINEVICFCGNKITTSLETLKSETVCDSCGRIPMTTHPDTIKALKQLNKLFREHNEHEVISIRYNAGSEKYEVEKDEKA